MDLWWVQLQNCVPTNLQHFKTIKEWQVGTNNPLLFCKFAVWQNCNFFYFTLRSKLSLRLYCLLKYYPGCFWIFMYLKHYFFANFILRVLKQYCLDPGCRGGSPFQPNVQKTCVDKFCREFISSTYKTCANIFWPEFFSLINTPLCSQRQLATWRVFNP